MLPPPPGLPAAPHLEQQPQELEKFKFVLDYKIKELKKQIEPKDLEISEMKEQIKEMDGELERYHKTNANLDLTISNMHLKQAGLANEVTDQRREKQDAYALMRRFQHDLQEVVGFLQEPKVLKEKVRRARGRRGGGGGCKYQLKLKQNQPTGGPRREGGSCYMPAQTKPSQAELGG